MRVYFNGNKFEGCYYYRCLLPLQENGWNGDRITMQSDLISSKEATTAMWNSDVIVMHRPFEKARKDLFLLMKQLGKKIVFDNDDTFKVNDVMKLGKNLDLMNDSVDWFIKNSDIVTTTNEFLAEEYKKLNPNVVVLPNYINPDDIPVPQRNQGQKIRIGIIGSVAHTTDYKHIIPILEELSKRKDIQLVLFSLADHELYQEEVKYWNTLNVEWQPFVHMKDYFQTLANLKLDLVLIPRDDTYFNRCKSNVKFLECSMLKIPVIGQTYGDGQSPYDKDAGNIILANTLQDWRDAIYYLTGDKEYREFAGQRAYDYVLKNYNIKDHYKKWKETYQTLL